MGALPSAPQPQTGSDLTGAVVLYPDVPRIWHDVKHSVSAQSMLNKTHSYAFTFIYVLHSILFHQRIFYI